MNRKQRRRAVNENGNAQAVAPFMQEIWPMSAIELTEPDEDGDRALVIQVPAPRKVMVFPINADTAKELGEKALASHVQTATPAEAAASGIILP